MSLKFCLLNKNTGGQYNYKAYTFQSLLEQWFKKIQTIEKMYKK